VTAGQRERAGMPEASAPTPKAATAGEFVALVASMRKAQKEFFWNRRQAGRSQILLRSARDFERRVDEAVAGYYERVKEKAQPKLF